MADSVTGTPLEDIVRAFGRMVSRLGALGRGDFALAPPPLTEETGSRAPQRPAPDGPDTPVESPR